MTHSPALNIVIPMAGEGSRFKEQGYTLPKPFIDVQGKPMIARVIENIALPDADYRLIIRTEDYHAYPEIINQLEKSYPITWIMCDTLTQGAACTVLLAQSYINSETPLLLANSDQLVDFSLSLLQQDALLRKLDGNILTFPETSQDPKWSYAQLDDAGYVTKTAEKQPISIHATVGIYYFHSGKKFIKAAQQMIDRNDRYNNEFYVCPIYNYLIAEQEKIGIMEIPRTAMHGLGTPEDLQAFLARKTIPSSHK